MAKLQDMPGLAALAAQTVLDLGMLSFAYLPVFYTFKASVFSSTWDPSEWVKAGIGNYTNNFAKDAYDGMHHALITLYFVTAFPPSPHRGGCVRRRS